MDSGIPYVIANTEGRRLTPSVVHVSGAAAEPIVGQVANRVRVLKPRETVYSVKRFMGRRGSDIPREDMLVTYPVTGEGTGPVTIELHGRAWTPETLAADLAARSEALQRDVDHLEGLRWVTLHDEGPGPLPARTWALTLRR